MNVVIYLPAKGLSDWRIANILIDTGSNTTFISQAFADILDTTVVGRRLIIGVPGEGPDQYETTTVELILGIGNRPLRVTAATHPDIEWDIILGTDYLQDVSRLRVQQGMSPIP